MIGTPRAHWRLTDSTNERAKELAAGGAPHGTLVTADGQSAGRGRQGRVWTAPPRSALLMTMSVTRLTAALNPCSGTSLRLMTGTPSRSSSRARSARRS